MPAPLPPGHAQTERMVTYLSMVFYPTVRRRAARVGSTVAYLRELVWMDLCYGNSPKWQELKEQAKEAVQKRIAS